MDKAEAKRILDAELAKYRSRGYDDLQRLLKDEDNFVVNGPDAKEYQIEIIAVWDDREHRKLRVIGSIDDGGWSAFSPVSSDFVILPDNTFVGE